MAGMLELFPQTARVEDCEVVIGGVRLSALASEYGTPLVVYDESTILTAARAYRRTAPDGLIVFGVKAFPNVAVLRLLAAEGLGADVSTRGELEVALRAGVPSDRLVVHGNNKSADELAAAARFRAGYVVIDSLDEVDRAAEAGVRRILVRVTPGIAAATHPSIRTAQEGSKFGLPPEQAIEAVSRAIGAGLEAKGLHMHIGSQLLDARSGTEAIGWIGAFSARCRDELGWWPEVIDLGGGLGIQYVQGERPPTIESFVGALVRRLGEVWSERELPIPRLVLEPGRSLVGRAGVTVYSVGVVKQVSDGTTYVAIDGGMSDNPRPQLYRAEYRGLLANRANERADGSYVVCGKHCESGDVLIRGLPLPSPVHGDLLAVPATGAYTLAMASNYNSVPRPAAVLVADGQPRLIRTRETIDDLLDFEVA